MALSSKYTKGIEIEIGGNATGLKTALDQANKAIKTTQGELNTLKNGLKLEWNADNFKRAQELAQRALQQTNDKAEVLKKALADLESNGETNTERYEAIRRELSYVEVAAQKAQQQLTEINKTRFEDLQKSLEKTTETLDKMGNKLTAGVTAPLMAAGAAAVNYASDTSEAINKVEVAFGDQAEAIVGWSNSTLTAFGLAKGSALDMAALYGDMATGMGASKEMAADMSRTLVGLAADLASFKNISVDQASTALKSIFTGETETLKNLGVVMTEANLKAYAMAEGYETAYKEMTQLEKVQLRYNYVLDQTTNAQGDFQRTSDGTANQLRICQESLKELAATMGEDLLPIVTPMISKVNDLLQSFGDLDEGTRKNITQALLFAATLGPLLKLVSTGTSVVSAGVTAYGALTAALAAKQAADVGATATQTALNVAMTANPAGALATAIGVLVAALGAYAVSAKLVGDTDKELSQQQLAVRDAMEGGAAGAEEVRKHMAELRGETDETDKALDALETTMDGVEQVSGDLAAGLDEAADSAEDANTAFDTFTSILDTVKDKYDLLYKAQTEANESGYISLDTVSKLIDSGLTEYLEETEGGYRLAADALDDYLALQLAEYESAYNDAEDAARKIVDAEELKAAGYDTTTLSLKEQLKAKLALLAVEEANVSNLPNANEVTRIGPDGLTRTVAQQKQVELSAQQSRLQAALDAIDKAQAAVDTFGRIRTSLGRDATTTTTTSKTSSSTTKSKEKTQAELDLESYQNAVAELDHLRAMDEIAEAEYYDRKAELAERFLTENKETYQKWQEELYSYQKGVRERDLTANKDTYDELMADTKYMMDMDIISEEEYYNEMERLRDSYLEEDSEAWRNATTAIYKYRKESREKELEEAEKAYQEQVRALEQALNDELAALKTAYSDQQAAAKEAYAAQKTAAKDAYDAQKAAAKEAYNAKKAQIKEELAAEKQRLNGIIDSINEEIEARKRLREDQSQDDAIAKAQKSLEAAQAQLTYARTDEDRAEWQKEVIRRQQALDAAIQDKEDTAFYRQKDEEKDAVSAQIDAAEAAADTALTKAESDYNAKLTQLEDGYNSKLAQLEDSYNATLADLESKYNSAVASVNSRYSDSSNSEPVAGKTYSDEVRSIARANDVDLGVAQDMYNANQRALANGTEPLYKNEAQMAASSSGASGSGTSLSSGSKSTTVNVTVNQATGITTQQVVSKVISTVKKLASS